MRIKEITLTGSRTINLGNFNSIKVEGSCTVSIDENEQDEFFIDTARSLAMQEVKKQMNELYNKLKPSEKKNE